MGGNSCLLKSAPPTTKNSLRLALGEILRVIRFGASKDGSESRPVGYRVQERSQGWGGVHGRMPGRLPGTVSSPFFLDRRCVTVPPWTSLSQDPRYRSPVRAARAVVAGLAMIGTIFSSCKRKQSCPAGATTQIVGGRIIENAPADEHGRRTAALVVGSGADSTLCSVSLVALDAALTAKHCVLERGSKTLIFGTHVASPTARRSSKASSWPSISAHW